MSIVKLKRDLISCGKDFFIDNYHEIKSYIEDDISKEDLDSIIKSKDKWSNISTLGNRVSAIKMIIENNQIEDALKITIGSRAKSDVINKAKEIFEEELGRKYDESIDRLDFDDSVVEEGNTYTNITKLMKIPLNQIFYGPPGTGKTYNISKEAEKIINSTNSTSANTREEKFNLICESIRNISGLEIKANSLYRNERAILWMFGYLLEPPHYQ